MRSILFGTVASLALVSGAAIAAPGGNGHGKENQGSAKNGGGAKAQSHKQAVKKKAGGNHQAKATVKAKTQSNLHSQKQAKAQTNVKVKSTHKIATKTEHKVQAKKIDKASKVKVVERTTVRHQDRRDVKRAAFRDTRGREFRVPVTERVRVITDRRPAAWRKVVTYRSFDGCPPGLARKHNGCLPPGLAKASYTRAWDRPTWYYGDYDRSYRYRYHDGYMLRLSPANTVLGYVPLLGGALAIGQAWPTAYQPVALPSYYTDYYDLGPASGYRAYGDTIYRVNPETSAISSVAALLTGNDITIGQPMPTGYEVYNVPYNWRDQYFDTPDALYRYSDGYVYQMDPTTRLVQAAIELLV